MGRIFLPSWTGWPPHCIAHRTKTIINIVCRNQCLTTWHFDDSMVRIYFSSEGRPPSLHHAMTHLIASWPKNTPPPQNGGNFRKFWPFRPRKTQLKNGQFSHSSVPPRGKSEILPILGQFWPVNRRKTRKNGYFSTFYPSYPSHGS